MNQKGGVGKTTSAVNLAAALARADVRTLLIDLDPQAHASLHLGIEPDDRTPTVYDVLLSPLSETERAHSDDPATFDPASAVIEHSERLHVMPAITDLAAAETELASAPSRHHRLRGTLAALSDRYDRVIIDCPPSLGLLTLNGLAAAGGVVIPMQAHFLALQGVGKLLETVALVAQQVNPSLRVLGVILCMHDEQARHTREVVADIEAFFEQARDTDVPWAHAAVLRPAIRRNIKLAESPSFGQHIFEYDETCAGAKDYAALSKALLQDGEPAAATKGQLEAKPIRASAER